MKKIRFFLIVYIITLIASLAIMPRPSGLPTQHNAQTAAVSTTASTAPVASIGTPEQSAATLASAAPSKAPEESESPGPSATPETNMVIQLSDPKESVITAPNSESKNIPDIKSAAFSTRYCETDKLIYFNDLKGAAIDKKTGNILKNEPAFISCDDTYQYYSVQDAKSGENRIVKKPLSGDGETVIVRLKHPVSDLFLYGGKLYYTVADDPANILYRVNADGSGSENFLSGIKPQTAVLYGGKAYAILLSQPQKLVEKDLGKRTQRSFMLPQTDSDVLASVNYDKLFYGFTYKGSAKTAVVDLTNGRPLGVFEKTGELVPFGQYLFYVKGTGTSGYSLNAYNAENGALYRISGLADINTAAKKQPKSVCFAFATGSHLYVACVTDSLYIFRVDIAGGKAQLTKITAKPLP